jgi:predicted esterase
MFRSRGGRAIGLGALALGLTLRLPALVPDTSVLTLASSCASVPEAAAAAPPSLPSARTQIGVPEQNPLELYPPTDGAKASPIVLALHGRDMDPIDMCERWSREGRAHGWLVCPAGNMPDKESFDWGGSSEERLAALDAQLAAVDVMYGSFVDHRADVVVGFSRGAFLARDLVEARPGRFRAMIVLGAAVRLDAERLRASGIRRVLLACGDKDEARPTMTRTASRLAASGIETKFMSLGPIYHVLPEDLGRVMHTALAWVTTP